VSCSTNGATLAAAAPGVVAIPVFRLRRAGGVERYTWEVAAFLARRGHRVRVVCGRGGRAPDGVECIEIGRARSLNTYRGGLALATFPARARAHLAFARGRPVLYGPVGSLLPPGVVAAHSVHAAWVRARARFLHDSHRTMFDRSQLAIERLSFRMPHTLVTANSPRCADDLADLYGLRRDSIIVIPPGIDPGEFSPMLDEERTRARQRFSIDASAFVVGIAANYAFRNKGVASLVRACARCSVTLVVAGIPDRKLCGYEQLARDEGADVHFVGSVATMRAVYATLDMFALPSLYESYGMAAHEAMACGVATVVSSTTGIAGLSEGNEHLFTVEPHDIDDLAAAIDTLSDDARRRALAEKGARWAHARTWSDVGADVAKAIHNYATHRG
jgi:glycosyltransferase involved in cell wall biosynthesis